MIVIFEKEYLMELYVSGKTSDKKHRFQPEIIKGYKKRIDYMKAVEKVEDFFKLPSLRFENLVGDKEGRAFLHPRQRQIQDRVHHNRTGRTPDINMQHCRTFQPLQMI